MTRPSGQSLDKFAQKVSVFWRLSCVYGLGQAAEFCVDDLLLLVES